MLLDEILGSRGSRANLNFKLLNVSILTCMKLPDKGVSVYFQICFKTWPTYTGRSWERIFVTVILVCHLKDQKIKLDRKEYINLKNTNINTLARPQEVE